MKLIKATIPDEGSKVSVQLEKERIDYSRPKQEICIWIIRQSELPEKRKTCFEAF